MINLLLKLRICENTKKRKKYRLQTGRYMQYIKMKKEFNTELQIYKGKKNSFFKWTKDRNRCFLEEKHE